jgi:putative colanic acid biosynthesis acetyltransferase WcaF
MDALMTKCPPEERREVKPIGEETFDRAFSGAAELSRDRFRRVIWNICWSMLYRPSPRPLHSWRTLLLRAFGAKMGPDCHFYPKSKVWAPWNLVCADLVTLGDEAEIYNPAPIVFGSHAIVSQGAMIFGALNDFDDPGFRLLADTSRIGAYAWICARASLGPGVNVGEGAVLGLASVATADLDEWGVYAGCPARKIKDRRRRSAEPDPSEDQRAK